jgi:hypothetical protein
MTRKRLYSLWILAFGLKAAGAAWDASYHFKYLRELTQQSHIMNFVGNALACLLWWYMWRTEPKDQRRSLKVIGIGFIAFFLAIPVDDWWHRTYGIDLTTWSPPHSTFYLATFVMILGMILQVSQDFQRGLISMKMRQTTQLLLFPFLLENFWFPLVQQEQGVIAYYLFQKGTPIATEEILQFLSDPRSQIYGGIPDWLYGVYGCMIALFVFTLIRKMQLGNFAVTKVAFLYVLFRFIMNTIFHFSTYQESAVPYYLIVSALVFDLIMKTKAAEWLKVTFVSLVVVLCPYLVGLIQTDYPIHPPLPFDSSAFAFVTALIGYAVAAGLFLWLKPSCEGTSADGFLITGGKSVQH